MLSFDLRSLEAKAATVDDRLAADDPVWQDGDPKPDTAVTVKGRLSAAGSGQFYWHGVSDLPHAFRTASFEAIVIREGLDSSGFSDRKIAD